VADALRVYEGEVLVKRIIFEKVWEGLNSETEGLGMWQAEN
jgi:hypothetical protein